ncbi:hypothetical protein ANCDUO_19260, partial [Ancylostoma duodenale]
MVNTMSSYSNSTTGRRRLITKTDAEEKALDRISREVLLTRRELSYATAICAAEKQAGIAVHNIPLCLRPDGLVSLALNTFVASIPRLKCHLSLFFHKEYHSAEAEARMRVKRETREQARQHRYTLLEKRVEEDAEVYRQDAASTSNGLQNCNDGNAKLQ